MWLKFELIHKDFTVEHISHRAMKTPPWLFDDSVAFYIVKPSNYTHILLIMNGLSVFTVYQHLMGYSMKIDAHKHI